jgi:hypothetical protein
MAVRNCIIFFRKDNLSVSHLSADAKKWSMLRFFQPQSGKDVGFLSSYRCISESVMTYFPNIVEMETTPTSEAKNIKKTI